MDKIELKPSAFLVQLTATTSTGFYGLREKRSSWFILGIFFSPRPAWKSLICFLACQTGLVSSWPSSTIALFQSNETVLAAPMTTYEISLLGSLTSVGSLVATPFCGYAFNNFGRKYATVLFGLPYVLSWAIISLSKSVSWILMAMVIFGIGIAGQNSSLIYISEISHDAIRGGMTALSASGYFLGLMAGYGLGGYLSYYQLLYANITMSALAMVLVMLLQESPVYLVLVGKIEEARKSISFYNRVGSSSKEVEYEIKRIRIQLDPRLEKMLEAENDPEAVSRLLTEKADDTVKPHTESAWKLLKQSKSSKRALLVVVVAMVLSVMMGSAVVQIYAEPLFKEAVPTMSANLCSILLAAVFLVASCLCVLIIDRFGRKNLFIVTSLGSGICNLFLGTQLHIHWAGHWLSVTMIYVFSFVYTLGCAVIPFVLSVEVFLPEVRSLCNSIVMASLWVSLFVLLFIFNPLVDLIGLGPIFYCFSAICFAGAFFCHVALPETKELSADAIQALFLKKK